MNLSECTLDRIKKQLCTPVIGDILDQIGLYHQFLPQSIRPMKDDMKIIGYAMPVLMTDVFEPQEKPFGYLTEAIDNLSENEIYIATGGTMRCAYWGELLTAAAKMRNAAGAIIYGWHRDTVKVLEQNWPVFSLGSYAQDSSVRTQVIQYRCTTEIGNVRIRPGDLIFGDQDGVIVIPTEKMEFVLEEALAKSEAEKEMRKSIENGMSLSEAFKVYEVL